MGRLMQLEAALREALDELGELVLLWNLLDAAALLTPERDRSD